MIKGTTEGDYLNIYNDPAIEPKEDTPYKRFDEYYSWLLGPDNWKIENRNWPFV